MTLLITEVFDGAGTAEPFVVYAADRCISVNGQFVRAREKIFRVPHYRAGIGYFGLAEVPVGGARTQMRDWLSAFLTQRSPKGDLGALARDLADALNAAVPSSWRAQDISGIHLSGFDDGDRPVFWYVRNVDDDRRTLLGEYRAREDYRRRDLPGLRVGELAVYRNGDIRAHVLAWEEIDKSLGRLLGLPGFQRPASIDEYVEWVRFKMQTIARFYEKFCSSSIIGEPIDAFAVRLTDSVVI